MSPALPTHGAQMEKLVWLGLPQSADPCYKKCRGFALGCWGQQLRLGLETLEVGPDSTGLCLGSLYIPP